MTSFCQACGAQRDPNARFCTSCGAASGGQSLAKALPASRRTPWGVWLGAAGIVLALVGAVGLVMGKGVSFAGRNADIDGDGIISESELRAEIAAIPQVETGQWQVTIERTRNGREPRSRTRVIDVATGNPLELLGLDDGDRIKVDREIRKLSETCSINHINLSEERISGEADCNERGEKFGLSLKGIRSGRSILLELLATTNDGRFEKQIFNFSKIQ